MKRLKDATPEEVEAIARELGEALRGMLEALPPSEKRKLDIEITTARELLARDPEHRLGKLTPAEAIEYFEARAAVALRRTEATKRSAEKRKLKNVERDRRIHDAKAAGKSQMVIALDESLSESWVSRILKMPRP